MSASSVLTLGYGSFGSVSLITTLGYLSSSMPTPTPTPTPAPTQTPTQSAGYVQGQRDWPNFIGDGDDNDYTYLNRKKKREKEEREVMALVKAFLRTLH